MSFLKRKYHYPSGIRNLWPSWLSCVNLLVYLLTKTFE